MKKILVLLLSLVLCACMLISCGENDELGGYIDNYPETTEKVEKLTLNLYIITDDRTDAFAETTVKRMITQHTELTFKTELVIYYVKASEYNAVVNAAVNSTGSDAANIVLINSVELMNNLMASGKLADLSSYYDSRDYGSLNDQITKALIDGSKINGKLYSVPNNHKIGEYKYMVINKEMARDTLKFSPSLLDLHTYPDTAYNSIEAASELMDKIREYGANPEDYVYYVTGDYELKAELEARGNYCNVVKYPTVDESEAFSSAFAIVNRDEKYVARSMQIIYAINSDSYLRNLLQYGVEGTNYTINNGNVERVTEGENVYFMNLEYTGDIFKAYYCDAINWTPSVADNASKQNKEAVMN